MTDQNGQGVEASAERLPTAPPDGTDPSAEVYDGKISAEAEAQAENSNREVSDASDIFAAIQQNDKFRALNDDELERITDYRARKEHLKKPGAIIVPLSMNTKIHTTSGTKKVDLTGIPLQVIEVEGGAGKRAILVLENKVTGLSLRADRNEFLGGNAGLIQRSPENFNAEDSGNPNPETALSQALKKAQETKGTSPKVTYALKEGLSLDIKSGAITYKDGSLRQEADGRIVFIQQTQDKDGNPKQNIISVTDKPKIIAQIDQQVTAYEKEQEAAQAAEASKKKSVITPTDTDEGKSSLPVAARITQEMRPTDLKQARMEASRYAREQWRPLEDVLIEILSKRAEQKKAEGKSASTGFAEMSVRSVTTAINALSNPELTLAWQNRLQEYTLSDPRTYQDTIKSYGVPVYKEGAQETWIRTIRTFKIAGFRFDCYIDLPPDQRPVDQISRDEKLILSTIVLRGGDKVQFRYTPQPEWEAYQASHLTAEQRRRAEFEARQNEAKGALLAAINELVERSVIYQEEDGRTVYTLDDLAEKSEIERSLIVKVSSEEIDTLINNAQQLEAIAANLRDYNWSGIEIDWEQGAVKGEIVFHDYRRAPSTRYRERGRAERRAPAPTAPRPAAPRGEARSKTEIQRELAELKEQYKEDGNAVVNALKPFALQEEFAALPTELLKAIGDLKEDAPVEQFAPLIREFLTHARPIINNLTKKKE